MLKTGIIGTSRKENEYRVPIHPEHFQRIPQSVRSHIVLDTGYGAAFGVSDQHLSSLVSRIAEREDVLRTCDLVVLPKPEVQDIQAMKPHATFWGWPHCVQKSDMTQAAIDSRLTVIAFEAMYHWVGDQRGMHVFCINNELAGYCGVFDALRLRGQDGHYGPKRRAVILSFGSVSRGAAHALAGRGFHDITIYTQRPPYLVGNQSFGCEYRQMRRVVDGKPEMLAVEHDGATCPLVDVLAEADIIVNGILQDTEAPVMYIGKEDTGRLKPGCMIIDLSCDLRMGFPFSRPTSFDEPVFEVGAATYYAVDHTPSYLWDSASWNISEAMLPYLPNVMSGANAWAQNACIRQAIDIREGVIQNPRILSFQCRAKEYPHIMCDS